MYSTRPPNRFFSARYHPGLALASVLLLTGCPAETTFPPPNGSLTDGNRGGGSSDTGKTSGEPNGSFAQAIVALFDANGSAALQGTVSDVGDLDVFNLGGLAPGDRVTVDVRSNGSSLDSSIAVFDNQERLAVANDDRQTNVRFLDAFVDFIVGHESTPYYLVVTHSAFADAGTFIGTYTVDVRVVRNAEVPSPVGQVLMLDFDGATIDTPALVVPLGVTQLDIAPFDAGNISPIYEGLTADLKEAIRAGFEQNFSRFDVTIVTTDDPPPPPSAAISTVFLGGFNVELFGLAERVDASNADFCDDAIIFVETFAPSSFSFTPTLEELAIAIANVGSHEAGHLLGLNHVDDDGAIMDDRSATDVFATDQEYIWARLSADIMSIGTQDAPLLLFETVGAGSITTTKRFVATGFRTRPDFGPSRQIHRRMRKAAQQRP